MDKLIVGCGYLGRRVARRWIAEGFSVAAVTRRSDGARELERLGIRPIVADVTRPETLSALPAADTLLYAVGYDRSSGTSRRAVYVDGLQAVLDVVRADAGRVLFVSSTGVYGQTGGSLVDEESPCRPIREGGRVVLAAEEVLRNHPLGGRSIMLRLAGIYGPGRIPRMADLLAGCPIVADGSGHLNLIHVDDAAVAVLAAAVRARPPRTYAVADGYPVLRRDFYFRLAELLDVAPPTFVGPADSAGEPTRGGGDKRVDNRRMLAELGISLKYPTYQEGLAAIVADG
jgi:nucleoside-diphosphate-sugar epimerase